MDYSTLLSVQQLYFNLQLWTVAQYWLQMAAELCLHQHLMLQEVWPFIRKCKWMKCTARLFLSSNPIPPFFSQSGHFILCCVIMINITLSGHFSKTHSLSAAFVRLPGDLLFLFFLSDGRRANAAAQSDVRATRRCPSPLIDASRSQQVSAIAQQTPGRSERPAFSLTFHVLPFLINYPNVSVTFSSFASATRPVGLAA